MDTANPAISGVPRQELSFYFTASSERKAVWTLVRQLRGPHFKHVGVLEQAVEQGGDGRGVPEELPPVLDRAVGGEDRGGPLVAAA